MTGPTALSEVKMGILGVSYYGTAGATAATVLGIDTKVSLDIANTVAKYNSRAQPIMTSKVVAQEFKASFSIIKDEMNASIAAIIAAAQAGTIIAMKFLDSVSGSGIDADWNIESYKESQDKDKEVTIDIELTLVLVYRTPTFVTGS